MHRWGGTSWTLISTYSLTLWWAYIKKGLRIRKKYSQLLVQHSIVVDLPEAILPQYWVCGAQLFSIIMDLSEDDPWIYRFHARSYHVKVISQTVNINRLLEIITLNQRIIRSYIFFNYWFQTEIKISGRKFQIG